MSESDLACARLLLAQHSWDLRPDVMITFLLILHLIDMAEVGAGARPENDAPQSKSGRATRRRRAKSGAAP